MVSISPAIRSNEVFGTDRSKKMARESVDPQIPWLYNFEIDFRLK